ncbi:tyrosine-type recombinase/integrase [Pseudoalteromonas rubra]|uniref:tyrosine-type recombinase/integrase n=1 Tax=Pseudoalteromonas rubra TaxID=43658 RepID=UPI000F77D598|nr:tyrosine-type recombinase/integrase [Pseudoalteromonas rubra]
MGSRKKYPGISTRKLSGGSETLYVSFQFEGEQCRERLPGLNPDKKGDWDYAFGLKLEIQRKITMGQFNYEEYFPNSSRLKKLGLAPSTYQTVKYYLDQYVTNAEKRGLSISTIIGYKKAIDKLKPLHDMLAAKLEPVHIKGYIQETPVSLKTMRNRLSVLNSAMNEAVIDGVLKYNPCASVKANQYMNSQHKVNTRGKHEDVDPFRPNEVKAILAACRNPQEKNLLQFAFFTGLRSSELAGLKWIDVDLINEEVRVTEAVIRDPSNKTSVVKGPKTSAGARVVELAPEAIEALTSQREFTKERSEYVFEEPKQRKPLTGADQIRKNIWVPVLNACELRYRNPYQTRHTFATRLISEGKNLWWIAKQMGHDGPEMLFRHYGNYIEEYDRDSGNGFNSRSRR